MSDEHELIPQNDPEDQPPVPAEESQQRLLFTPPMDIYEAEEGFVLVADLPGVTREHLELQVQDNKLTLFGRVNSYVPEGMLARHEEYGIGDFLRSFILPDVVDHERISAKLNNGVLQVVLPKAEQAEPRKINVDEGE